MRAWVCRCVWCVVFEKVKVSDQNVAREKNLCMSPRALARLYKNDLNQMGSNRLQTLSSDALPGAHN